MTKIVFKDTWFGPGGRRFRKGIHNVPDEFCGRHPEGHARAGRWVHLPSSARPAVKADEAPANTDPINLRHSDGARLAAQQQADMERKADEQRQKDEAARLAEAKERDEKAEARQLAEAEEKRLAAEAKTKAGEGEVVQTPPAEVKKRRRRGAPAAAPAGRRNS